MSWGNGRPDGRQREALQASGEKSVRNEQIPLRLKEEGDFDL